MRFPKFQETETYREMTTVFGGYNHQISCKEGQFFDMKNMTSNYYPILSPRGGRGIIRNFTYPQGMLDKEDMWWIDDKKLYRNGEEKTLEGVTLSDEAPKTMAKMGAYIIIMPDKVWYNAEDGTCGYMENKVIISSDKAISFSLCKENGSAINWHSAEYYEANAPKDGDYMMTTTTAGKPSLKIYSASTSIWSTVASAYVQITAEGIGEGFEKEDGIKLTSTYIDSSFENIFINKEEDGTYSTNTYIVDKTEDSITIPGILGPVKEGEGESAEMTLTVERKVPEMSFITECNNRLWGCSKDGHEIYCCKLGDVKNWYCYRGMSTDSWAATVGSDGKFTGAITFAGYPMFFKEDGLLKISISTTGGHAVKETRCRGVQNGSDRSLVILNETLYYKSSMGICGYSGSLPYSISDEFGDVKYYDAVAGALGDKYFVSMKASNGEHSLFVYDSKSGIWCKEDSTEAIYFCRHKDDLYFIDADGNILKSIDGSVPSFAKDSKKEDRVEWFAESGTIGYSSPDNKYVGRINLRITLEFGTNVDFFIQYDSNGIWEHKFNMSGQGTRTYSIPIIPKRCDHFKYKISGNGGCKIHSVTKTIEGGSDD